MMGFAEFIIGRAFATRWLYPSYKGDYLPTHFGARFSENAFGPSI